MRSLFIGACCALIWACGSDQQSAGNGGIWDETENSVRLSVRHSDGSAAANAQVLCVAMGDWIEAKESGTSPRYYSGTTNSKGELYLNAPPGQQSWMLEAKEGKLGAARLYALGDTAVEMVLDDMGSLQGSLARSESLPDSIYLAGTRMASAVDARGSFRFAQVPHGLYGLMGRTASRMKLVDAPKVSPDSATHLSTLPWNAGDSVLLDDFSDDLPANRYHALSGAGWWYNYADSASWIEPASMRESLVKGDSAWQKGQSLHVKLQVQDLVKGHFALCGVDLEQSYLMDTTSMAVIHDLRGLDSLTFQARGTGTIKIQLSGAKLRVQYAIKLNQEWTRHSIAVSDLDSALWTLVAPRTIAINFLAEEPAELWLDQIQLHGISESDLFAYIQ